MGNGPPGSGDGWLYRGHGLMQLTGRNSYEKHAEAIGKPLADLPDYLTTPVGAATSAAWEWNALGCSSFADVGNLTKVRLLINGGTIGLDLVMRRYKDACKALDIQ